LIYRLNPVFPDEKLLLIALFFLVWMPVARGQELEQETTGQLEQYVPKVIIQGKWGDKPGEFGLAKGDPYTGPWSFAVDLENNIYILLEFL
jgi:hypothetical protein